MLPTSPDQEHYSLYIPQWLNIFETIEFVLDIQSNLHSSNTDGSFTMANSNSFLSPYEIFPLAQENNY